MAHNIDIKAGDVTNIVNPEIYDIVINKSGNLPEEQAFFDAIQIASAKNGHNYRIEERPSSSDFILHTTIESGQSLEATIRRMILEVQEEGLGGDIGTVDVFKTTTPLYPAITSSINNNTLGFIPKGMSHRLEQMFNKGVNAATYADIVNNSEEIDLVALQGLLKDLGINPPAFPTNDDLINAYSQFIKQTKNLKEQDFVGGNASVKFLLIQRLLRMSNSELLRLKMESILAPTLTGVASNVFDYTKLTQDMINQLLKDLGNTKEEREYLAGVLKDRLITPGLDASVVSMLRFLVLPKGASIIELAELPKKSTSSSFEFIRDTKNLSRAEPAKLTRVAKIWGFEDHTSVGFDSLVARLKLLSNFDVSEEDLYKLRFVDPARATPNSIPNPRRVRGGVDATEEMLDEMVSKRLLNLGGVANKRPVLYGEMVPYLKWIFEGAAGSTPAGVKSLFMTWIYSQDFISIDQDTNKTKRLDNLMQTIQRDCPAIPRIPSDPNYNEFIKYKLDFIKNNIRNDTTAALTKMPATFNKPYPFGHNLEYISQNGKAESIEVHINPDGSLPEVNTLYLENRQALSENMKSISLAIQPFFNNLASGSAFPTIIELVNSRERKETSEELMRIFQNLQGAGKNEFDQIVKDISPLLPDDTAGSPTEALYVGPPINTRNGVAKIVASRLLTDLLPFYTERSVMSEFSQYRFNHRDSFMTPATKKIVNSIIDQDNKRLRIEDVTYEQRKQLTREVDLLIGKRNILDQIKQKAGTVTPSKTEVLSIVDSEVKKMKDNGNEISFEENRRLQELALRVIEHPVAAPPFLNNDFTEIYYELDTSINNIFIIIGRREDSTVRNYSQSLNRVDRTLDQSLLSMKDTIKDQREKIEKLELSFVPDSPTFEGNINEAVATLRKRYIPIQAEFKSNKNPLQFLRRSFNPGIDGFLTLNRSKSRIIFKDILAYVELVNDLFPNFTAEDHQRLFTAINSSLFTYIPTDVGQQNWAKKLINGEARKALLLMDKIRILNSEKDVLDDQKKNGTRVLGIPTHLLKSRESNLAYDAFRGGVLGTATGGLAIGAASFIAAPIALPIALGAALGTAYTAYATNQVNSGYSVEQRRKKLLDEFNSLSDIAKGHTQAISQLEDITSDNGYLKKAKEDINEITNRYHYLAFEIKNKKINSPDLTLRNLTKYSQELDGLYKRLANISTTTPPVGAEEIRAIQAQISQVIIRMNTMMVDIIRVYQEAALSEIKPEGFDVITPIREIFNRGQPVRVDPRAAEELDKRAKKYKIRNSLAKAA